MERNEALKAAWHDNVVRANGEPLTLLVQAYRFHKAWLTPNGKARFVDKPAAQQALRKAREDAADGKRRYPASRIYPAVSWQPEGEGLAFVETPANAGLRHVGNVDCEGGHFTTRGNNGWFADNDSGSTNGTVCGVVFQLPGRDGKSRFVAGYRFSEHDGEGAMLDFSRVYEEPAAYYEPVRKTASGMLAGGYWNYQDNARDMDAATDAARAADAMAQRAAEEEREYQAAWQAGSRYADLMRESHDSRAEAVALLRERRAARTAGLAGYDAICASIRGTISAILDDLSKARQTMRKLAEGDFVSEYLPGFHTGEKRLREAFNEGANQLILR